MHLCVSIKRSTSHANTVRQRGKKSENEKNRVTKIMAHKREKRKESISVEERNEDIWR